MLPEFTMHRPASVAEACELLNGYGDEAAVYAGGSELLLVMKLGLADYPHLIDVKGIPDLVGLDAGPEGLVVGAGVTHRTVERSSVVRAGWPAFARMERGIANLRVRNVGTLGGNLCFADPHSDPATFLLAAGGVLEAQGVGGTRRIPAAEFWSGMYETALAGGEVLRSIVLPAMPPSSAISHARMAPYERPTATVTVFVRLAGERVAEARIAAGSVGPVPVRCGAAERLLADTAVDDVDAELAEAVGAAAADEVELAPDEHASPDYQRQLVRVLVQRGVQPTVGEAYGDPDTRPSDPRGS